MILDKVSIITIIVAILIVVVAGFTTNYQSFSEDGISLNYPNNLIEISVPANDQVLANKSGFNIIGDFIVGKEIGNYTFFMEIAVANITNTNFTEAVNRLNTNFILKEANSAPAFNIKTLKNGYMDYVFTYNGTGASSGLKIYEQTHIFTKDNQTAYYITFATPRTNMDEYVGVIQKIVDSIIIK